MIAREDTLAKKPQGGKAVSLECELVGNIEMLLSEMLYKGVDWIEQTCKRTIW
jgi:hypothetical protein